MHATITVSPFRTSNAGLYEVYCECTELAAAAAAEAEAAASFERRCSMLRLNRLRRADMIVNGHLVGYPARRLANSLPLSVLTTQ